MNDVAQDAGWWIASDGKWYPPMEQAPKPGWWLASDGQWYPPKKVKRSKVKVVASSAPTEQLPPVRVAARSMSMSYEAARQVAATQATAGKPWGLAVLVIMGGALMTIGAFLPWATVSLGFISVSVDGTYNWGDGWVALPIGAVLLLGGSALWGLRGWFWRVPPIVLAAGGIAVAVYDIVHITRYGHHLPPGPDGLVGGVTVAYGLIIVLGGALAAAVGGIGALVTWSRWDGDRF
jgi:hypothetical protein